MDWRYPVGTLLTVLSVAGYALGTVVAYPGRSFTITGVIVGLALLAIGRSAEPDPGTEAEAETEGD